MTLGREHLPLLVLILFCGSSTIACTKQIPPPASPPRSLPTTIDANEEDSYSAHGTPRTSLVVITTDVPAQVERSEGIEESLAQRGRMIYRSHRWETICAATPCSVRIPRGRSTFHFIGKDSDRRSIVIADIQSDREVINHTLGQEHGSLGTYVGAGLVVVGIALLIFPFGVDLDQHKAAPGIMVGTGIGSIFAGLTVMGIDPGVRQHGATTQWTPERASPAPPAPPPPSSQSTPSSEGSLLLPPLKGTALGFAF